MSSLGAVARVERLCTNMTGSIDVGSVIRRLWIVESKYRPRIIESVWGVNASSDVINAS